MLRLCGLGSGSTGNGTLIESRGRLGCTRLMIDCGFTVREAESRLLRAGVEPATVDAIFVTHEHADHIGSALAFARRHGSALWMSRGTWRAIGEPAAERLGHARDSEPIAVGALQLQPFTVPHDAREPLQLCVGDGERRIGVLTDVGRPTAHLLRQLQACDALVLECNHDRELLANSDYPAFLKARIASQQGHLANDLATEIVGQCAHAGLRHVVAAHLSERNNTPALAAAALAEGLGTSAREIVVADPVQGFGWLELR